MDLFDQHRHDLMRRNAPLADRMRPRTLDEFIGQEHIIGEGRLLRRAIQIDQLSSVIFYGPPGTGKTTLARIIANTTKAQFLSINAVLSGVKEIRESIDLAQKTLSLYSKRTILFVDEVHRFNKAQQDALLPHVENGVIILIGATTENPYFEVNKALVSRSRIFQLRQLTEADLKAVALQALSDKERGYGNRSIEISDDALEHLVKVSNGDARGVLNALELAVETTAPDSSGVEHIDRTIAEESIQQRAVLYDKDGDAHYDTISAFIKSVRGSDPDAALYWMAKMVYAGEDPRFIFRRLLILAGEDVGMADPKALGIVMDAARAFDFVGMPEGRYHLAHACLYLATAPKSNSSMAFFDALDLVSKEVTEDIPDPLRDASRDRDGFGHGAGYLYPHAYRDHWVAQQYLPASLQGKLFYQPGDQGYERDVKDRVARFREAQLEAMVGEEVDEATPLSIHATDGARDSSHGQWLERTLGSRGEQLGMVRERVLHASGIDRTSLVLDLNARSGLLAFEAARKVTEGGVWALAHDDKAFETLKNMASSLDVLHRPQIVRTSFETFEDDLRAAAGKKVKFDCILGRNILTRHIDKPDLFARAARLLGKNGALILSEIVPSQGQRLSDLIDTARFDPSFEKRFGNAEKALFADPDDPMVNWTVASLKESLTSSKNHQVAFTVAEQGSRRRILPRDIDYWFRIGADGERKSLGDRLSELFTDEELVELRSALHRQLDNREVSWKAVSVMIRAVAVQ